MSGTGGVRPRREPRQLRSRRRVERLLDAATRVFASQGLEGATTNAIAAEAGVSIGSLYQFFPNKAAILVALDARSLVQFRETLDRAFGPDAAALPLPELLARVLGALEDFHAASHGLYRVLTAASRSPETVAAERQLTREIVFRIEGLLAARFPALEPLRRAAVAAACVSATDALFVLSVNGDEGWRRRVLAEAGAMLLAYLGSLEAGGRGTPVSPRGV